MMAKVFLVLAFTVLGLIWISPYSQFGTISLRTTQVLGSIGAGLMILMIVLRMIIQMRPPITNLFDTFLFIGAVGFFLSLVIEAMTRKRIAISAGVILAMVCALLLGPFREINTSETMSPLEAVLDTNFWLWIHVTTINVGYCAGLLAALAAHFYIFGQAFNIDVRNRDLYRSLTRIVYGVACFSLFFSLVGTVLGGIWANYSWGRFWGWDPKENGALMIVLWTLVHLARADGRLHPRFGHQRLRHHPGHHHHVQLVRHQRAGRGLAHLRLLAGHHEHAADVLADRGRRARLWPGG